MPALRRPPRRLLRPVSKGRKERVCLPMAPSCRRTRRRSRRLSTKRSRPCRGIRGTSILIRPSLPGEAELRDLPALLAGATGFSLQPAVTALAPDLAEALPYFLTAAEPASPGALPAPDLPPDFDSALGVPSPATASGADPRLSRQDPRPGPLSQFQPQAVAVLPSIFLTPRPHRLAWYRPHPLHPTIRNLSRGLRLRPRMKLLRHRYISSTSTGGCPARRQHPPPPRIAYRRSTRPILARFGDRSMPMPCAATFPFSRNGGMGGR